MKHFRYMALLLAAFLVFACAPAATPGDAPAADAESSAAAPGEPQPGGTLRGGVPKRVGGPRSPHHQLLLELPDPQ